jgi:hypothetical protein
MKFINLTSVILMLLMLGIWLYWKPPAALIRLKEIEAVPVGEVRQQVEPTLWERLTFKPDLSKQDSLTPADYYLKQWPKLAIEDYDVVRVELDGQTRFFKAEVIDADSIWDRERIPDSQKFPYRMASYPLAAAVLLVIGFRKRIFGKQKPLVAYTAVGSGYRISQGVLLMALLLLALPVTYQVTNNTMGAIGVGGGILLLTGLIAFPIYAKAASELQNRFHEGGTEVLAEWLIPRDEWLSFLQHSVRKDMKKLMIFLGAITVFGMVSAHLVSHDEPNEQMVMVTFAAILTIIWLVTFVPAVRKRRALTRGSRTVRVYPFGVLLGKEIQLWNQPNCSCDGAILEQDPVRQISVRIHSMMLSNAGPVPMTSHIRFPVPAAEMGNAREIVETINRTNRQESIDEEDPEI